jgi:hypothetical protein
LCRKVVIGFDLDKRTVVKQIDLSVVMGGYRGMRNSFDSVSITVIPALEPPR